MALLWSARCVINPLSRVQSRYIRHFLDVPWQGVAMPLHLHTRRFFCDTIDGLRCIFPERFPAIIAPYARRTLRLEYCFPSRGIGIDEFAFRRGRIFGMLLAFLIVGSNLIAGLCFTFDKGQMILLKYSCL